MYRGWSVFLSILFVGSQGWGAPCSVKVEANPQFPEWTSYAKQRLLPSQTQRLEQLEVKKKRASKAKDFLRSLFGEPSSADNSMRELRLRELSSRKFTQWQQRQKRVDPGECLGGCPSYNPGFQFKAEKVCRVSVASEKGESHFDLPLSCTEFFSYYGSTSFHPLKAKVFAEVNSCS